METSDYELAIKVRSAVKSYGSNVVLKHLDMNVPYGSIYGLLGSSGCGKTTLLRCILGQFNLAKGYIMALGAPPGSRGHQVPGKDVGYMPQEMALYGDFTMSETLYYFGILHGMKLKDVRARREFLQEFLELPSQKKLIRTLSGGQKRRFSFAVAMLHQPPLMILDEPTVGVDPILRAKIWEHLMQMVSSGRTTIVITTHYIEEARQANIVGMMRDGRLLAEQSPSSLIESFRLTSLEEVFLQLCRKQDLENDRVTECVSLVSNQGPINGSINAKESNETTPLLLQSQRKEPEIPGRISSMMSSCKCTRNPLSCCPHPLNILALCWKNLMRVYRNPGLLIFQFIIPTFQIIIFSLAIGHNLTGIKIAYTNNDVSPFKLSTFCNSTDLENVSSFGELFISKLLQDNIFDMVKYENVEGAIAEVKEGKAWAALYLGPQFTVDLGLRFCSLNPIICYNQTTSPPVTNQTLNGSAIHIYADVTNFQITATINNQTLNAYEFFLEDLLHSCGRKFNATDSSILSSPIMVEPPIYGRNDLSFTDYMGPGMIISITFGISIGLCAVALITERNEGLIDRTWVAGVNVAEIIIAQIFTQFFILVVQITLLVVVAVFGFKIYTAYLPNVWLIGALAMIQGLGGMAFGLFLSAICSTENAAVQAAIAVFYPNMLLSGVLWPLEGMPVWLRYIGYALPSTFPAEAMRAIMGRGWGLEHFVVWKGILMSTGWFFLFLLMTGIAFSLRR